jgi:hypothetical protein
LAHLYRAGLDAEGGLMPSTSYAARNERFAQAGFGSYGQARRLARRLGLPGPDALWRPTSSKMLDAYPRAARQGYDRSVRALGLMRRDGVSLDVAARREGVPGDVVAQFGAGGRGAPEQRRALQRQRDGTYTTRSADRMLRPMNVIQAGVGSVVVDVRGSRAASTVGSYFNAVDHYLDTGDDGPLRRFVGVKVGGVELETDPETIEALAFAGLIDFESIYQVAS